jgi:IclR family KDG regulon transcriptional repressor
VPVTSSPVKSADRVLDILELLASEPDGLTVSQISSRLGIARSSTHGLVQTVAQRGYLRRDHRDGRRVALGASVVQLGLSVTDRLELRTIARGPLERLVAATHDTMLLAVPDHGSLIYLDKIFSDQRGFRTDPRASARSPLHASSLGKALLAAAGDETVAARLDGERLEPVTEFTIVDVDALVAELRGSRERGYSTDEQQAVLGVCCVGAPIRDHTGQLIGAISLSTIREFYAPDKTGPAVRDAALEISHSMGWNGDVKELYTAPPGSLEAILGVDAQRALSPARS